MSESSEFDADRRECLRRLDELAQTLDRGEASPHERATASAIHQLRPAVDSSSSAVPLRAAMRDCRALLPRLRELAADTQVLQATQRLERFTVELTERWRPDLLSEIDAGDLRPWSSELDIPLPAELAGHVQQLTGASRKRVDLVWQLLLDEANQSASPSRERFELRFDAPVQCEQVTERVGSLVTTRHLELPDALLDADSRIRELIGSEAGAVIAWLHSDLAGLTTTDIVRRHWWALIDSGLADDVAIVATHGAWMVTYCHHGHLRVAEHR